LSLRRRVKYKKRLARYIEEKKGTEGKGRGRRGRESAKRADEGLQKGQDVQKIKTREVACVGNWSEKGGGQGGGAGLGHLKGKKYEGEKGDEKLPHKIT